MKLKQFFLVFMTMLTCSAFSANAQNVAKIGDTEYATLQAAINAAESGAKVTLLKDITLGTYANGGSDAAITINKAITLDGNGKTFTSKAGRAININVAGEVEIKNLTIKQYCGRKSSDQKRCINVINQSATVVISGCTLEMVEHYANGATLTSYVAGVQAATGANHNITINGCNIKTIYGVVVYAAGSEIDIKNSDISNALYAAWINAACDIDVENSTITTKEDMGTNNLAVAFLAQASGVSVTADENTTINVPAPKGADGTQTGGQGYAVYSTSKAAELEIDLSEATVNKVKADDPVIYLAKAEAKIYRVDGTVMFDTLDEAIANLTADDTFDQLKSLTDEVPTVEYVNAKLEELGRDFYYTEDGEAAPSKPAIEVTTKAELDAAIANAVEGDVIKLANNLEYNGSRINIDKAITLDLNGKTITTNGSYGVIKADGGCSIKNGKIVYTGTNAIIKVWNAKTISGIEMEATNTSGAVIGGIVIQEGSTVRVDAIKNVTITGAGLTNGIQTYNCGTAKENVIGSMENVNIDAVGVAMNIYAPCGTATNCTFKGGNYGIEIWIKGTYNASLDLVNCTVEGGETYDVFVHDEFNNKPGLKNDGTLTLTADEATGLSDGRVLKTVMHESNLVVENKAAAQPQTFRLFYTNRANYVAEIGETGYETLQAAINAATAGQTITFVADITENVTIGKAVTIDGAKFTYTGVMTPATNGGIVIKNVNFDGKKVAANEYAVKVSGADYVTVEDCTAKNYNYGFVNVASNNVQTTVKNVTVSDMNYGVKVDYSYGVVLENADITAGQAAVLNSNYGEKTITIKDSKLNIYGTWGRNEAKTTNILFEGANTVGQFIIEPEYDNFKLAAGATLTAPEEITVTTVEKYEVKYENGIYKSVEKMNAVAKVGEQGYATLDEAFAAAADGNKDVELVAANYEKIVVPTGFTGKLVINGNVVVNNANGSAITGEVINISGNGTLTAIAAGKHAYGIGGNNTESITIEGVHILKVQGGHYGEIGSDTKYYKDAPEGGAAIGSGSNGAVITLTNVKIDEALGGSKAAGIGALYHTGVTINITGCTITKVEGGATAAAIGGSRVSSGATEAEAVTINIKNSTIEEAKGGVYAAGIGSGYDTHCQANQPICTINIDGSTINAQGGQYAAGIGTGYHNAGLAGEIKNSTITATSGDKVYKDTYTSAQDIGFGVADLAREGSNNNSYIVYNGTKIALPGTDVAQIGETGYETLAEAFAAANAAAGDYTITLLADNAEVFEFAQNSGVNITVDGEGKTFTGKITLNAGAGELTFTDMTLTPSNADAKSIVLNASTAPDVTIDGCTMKNTGTKGAIVWGQASATSNKVVITNSTASNLQYLVGTNQAGCDNVTVENVTATDMAYLIRPMKAHNVTVKNVTYSGITFVQVKNSNVSTLAIENVKVTTTQASMPPITMLAPDNGTASVNYTITLKGENVANGAAMTTANEADWFATAADGLLYEIINLNGLNGKGTDAEPYLIKNVNDLVLFRNSVNAGETKYNAEGVYVALAADIDLDDTDWSENIGDDCNATFDGIFDGKGCTIKNLTSEETAQKGDGYICTGLFGAIGGKAVVKNFTIENVSISTGEFTGNNVAAVVGFAYNAKGSIENVKVIGDININASKVDGTGVIVGYSYGGNLTVNGCFVSANANSVVTGQAYVGGIIGYATKATLNNNTVENIDITATSCCAAGVAGIMNNGGTATGNTVKNVNLVSTHENWKNAAAIVVGTITAPVTISGTDAENVTANGAATTTIAGAVFANKPTTPVAKVAAKIGDVYYKTLADALAAEGNEVTLLAPITVAADETLVLDLHGKTVSMVYAEDVTANHAMITNNGNLTIQSSVEGGKLSYTYAGKDLGTTFAVNAVTNAPGSVLTVKSGTIENLTYEKSVIAYAIDALTNGNGGDVTVNIEGGVVTSKRQAVRVFANSTTNTGALNISGGEFTGRVIVQNASAKANKAALNITGGTFNANNYKSDVLYVGGSNSETIDINATVSGGTFNGDITETHVTNFISGGSYKSDVTKYCVDGYICQNKNGMYGVLYGAEVAASGTWGGIDWSLTNDGTLTIAATAGEPVPDKNAPTKRTYKVGEWRETVIYKSNGSASAIGGAPYDMNAVKKLIIKEGVTKIGSFTCQFPNLTGEVVIPSTVTYFGQEAFHKTPITKLTFAAGGTEPLCIANGAFKKTLIEEVSFPGDREYIHIHHWAFGGSPNLKRAYIPANLTKSWGGEHVDYLNNFNAQTNVTWAEYGSIFTGCTKMETITFENEAVRNLFFANGRQSTAEDYIVAAANLVAYNTIENAIAAAEDGGDILLYKNVALKDTWTIPAGMNLTLNLNGKTLSQSKACTASYEMINNKGNLTITGNGKISFTDTSAGDPNFTWGSYTVRNEGNLVVENGTIEHKGAQAFATHMICAIYQYCGSTTINGGTISTPAYRSVRLWKGEMTINGGTFDGQVWVQAVDESAKLTINGGTFEPNGQDASSVFVENKTYDVEFAVTGGTFNGKVGCSNATKLAGAIKGGKFNEAAKNGTNTALLAKGYVFGELVDGYCEVVKANYVAQVGEQGYETLAEALAAATAGQTVTLLADITEDVTLSKNVTIDGANGEAKFQYTGTMTINNVTATIENVAFVKGQVYKHKSTGSNASITVKNCTFDGQGMDAYAVNLGGTSAIVLENVTAKGYGYGLLQVPSSCAGLTIKNVEVSNCYYGFKVDYANAVSMENVTIAADVTIGIYDSNYGDKTYTIKKCNISSISIWERSAAKTSTFKFEGTNTVAELTTSQYAKYVLAAADATLTAPETVTVTTDVADNMVVYENGTYRLEALKIAELTIVHEDYADLENQKNFENLYEKTVGTLTYTREIEEEAENKFIPICLPFEIPISAFDADKYDVAYINNVKTNGNESGEIVGMSIEYILIKSENAVLYANTPYMIRPKSAEALNLEIVVEDAKLHKTNELKEITMASAYLEFSIKGVYNHVSGTDVLSNYKENSYCFTPWGGDWWNWDGAYDEMHLVPFETSLVVTAKEGSPYGTADAVAAINKISGRVVGEEYDGTTYIYEVESEDANDGIYDLSGRRVNATEKGVYIVNGKKVLVK